MRTSTVEESPSAPEPADRRGFKRTGPNPRVVAVLLAVGSASLIVGGLILSQDRPQPLDTAQFDETGAAEWIDILTGTAGTDPTTRIEDGEPAGRTVSAVQFIGTADAPSGRLDLFTYDSTADDGRANRCVAVLGQADSSQMCTPEGDTDFQLSWGTTTNGPLVDERSAVVFGAPAEAAVMIVVLDTDRYVGADVIGGVSYAEWSGALGTIERVILLDANGNALQQRAVG